MDNPLFGSSHNRYNTLMLFGRSKIILLQRKYAHRQKAKENYCSISCIILSKNKHFVDFQTMDEESHHFVMHCQQN